MKFCTKCGAEMHDEAVLCVKCGCYVDTQVPPVNIPQNLPKQESGITTAAKIFMIIGTVIMALYTCCIGLAWCLPMTMSYFKKLKTGEPISTGFKICSLLFVNTIAGILMLCDHDH